MCQISLADCGDCLRESLRPGSCQVWVYSGRMSRLVQKSMAEGKGARGMNGEKSGLGFSSQLDSTTRTRALILCVGSNQAGGVTGVVTKLISD